MLTNHPLHSANNGRDICFILRNIKSAASVDALPPLVLKFVSRIARESGCSSDVVFIALSKVEADHNLPKLADIEMRLIDTLVNVWPRAQECSHGLIRRIALNLAHECERASSLAHIDVLPVYLPAIDNSVEAELISRIANKRIDRTRLLGLLDNGLNEIATLDGDPEDFIEPGTGTTELLRRKLDAGGFSIVSRNSAEDLRNKADFLGAKWINKYGRLPGLKRYDHIRSVVLRLSGDAFESTKSGEDSFGIGMRSELRNMIRQLRGEGAQLYDCSDDHLEGFAYSLTSQCRVQWSLDRPWEVQ